MRAWPHRSGRTGGVAMSVAIVTGASKGLGRALSVELARRGWDLVVDARGEHERRRAAAELTGPGRVVAVPGDVADDAHRHRLVDTATGLGDLELVVNNASTLGPSPLPPLVAYPL